MREASSSLGPVAVHSLRAVGSKAPLRSSDLASIPHAITSHGLRDRQMLPRDRTVEIHLIVHREVAIPYPRPCGERRRAMAHPSFTARYFRFISSVRSGPLTASPHLVCRQVSNTSNPACPMARHISAQPKGPWFTSADRLRACFTVFQRRGGMGSAQVTAIARLSLRPTWRISSQ